MKIQKQILPLFKQFIKETETGKRLKKNGERIKPQSIENYKYVLNNLFNFQLKQNLNCAFVMHQSWLRENCWLKKIIGKSFIKSLQNTYTKKDAMIIMLAPTSKRYAFFLITWKTIKIFTPVIFKDCFISEKKKLKYLYFHLNSFAF